MRSSASPSSRIETTRPIMRRSPCSGEADFLDSIRHSLFPDDVQALLLQGGSKRAEAVWLRLCDLRDDVVYGRLLNEPEQDLGVHEGDVLPLSFRNDEERVSDRAGLLGSASSSLEQALPLRSSVAEKQGRPARNRAKFINGKPSEDAISSLRRVAANNLQT